MGDERGFTYIEVLISILILLLLFETMWMGIRISQQSIAKEKKKVEATYLSEELVKALTGDSSEKVVGRDVGYDTDAYDYYIAWIDKAAFQSGDALTSEKVEQSSIKSNVSNATQMNQVTEIIKEMIDEGALQLKFEETDSVVNEPIVVDRIEIEGIEIGIENHVLEQSSYLTVRSGEKPTEEGQKRYENRPVRIPLEAILEGGGGQKVYIENQSSFPIVLEDAQSEKYRQVQRVNTQPYAGEITYYQKSQERKKSYIVIVVVMQKGGTTWQDVLKKQIVIL